MPRELFSWSRIFITMPGCVMGFGQLTYWPILTVATPMATYHRADCIFGQNRWHTHNSEHFGLAAAMKSCNKRCTSVQFVRAHTQMCKKSNENKYYTCLCRWDRNEKFTNFLKIVAN